MYDWKTFGENLINGQADSLRKSTEEALSSDCTAHDILEQGIMPAMEQLGEKFSKGEAYLPELLLAADTMKSVMDLIQSAVGESAGKEKATFLIGTVEGDIHDLGKNLVKVMLEGGGFNVIDLGTSVSAEQFIEAYEKEQPDIIGLSAFELR